MMPIVDGLEAEFDGRVPVLRLDSNEETNAQLQADYGLRGHPSFVVLDGNSRIVESYFGPQTAEAFRESMAIAAGTD